MNDDEFRSYRKRPVVIQAKRHHGSDMIIRTLEGDMICHDGDWIIQGVAGELYPCRNDIFERTYEEVK